jgi:hypothetical protein
MAKSTKFSSKVPALDDYKLPSWINEEGEVTDLEAAKKALHTLALDKAKAQDAREDALAQVAEVTVERDELQTKVDDKTAPDAQAELAKVQKDRDKAKEEARKAVDRADRLEVAMEKGLSPLQAKRLVGETKEELEADADEILELFGPKPTGDEDEDEELEGRVTPQSRVRLTNGGDPDSGTDAEPDYDQIAAEIGGDRIF